MRTTDTTKMQARRKRLRRSATPLAGALLIGLTAWLVAPTAADAAEPMSDQAITDRVEDELLIDDGVAAYKIDVATTDGVVTLTGSVNNILAKERAARVAQLIRGVRTVANHIDVQLSDAVPNGKLETEIEAALARDPATDAYEVKVAANDGAVTLAGTVDSFQEKELCATVAKGIRGVRSLRNMIDVDYQADRSDDEIKREIEQALRWNMLVDDGLIEVEVAGGKVLLDGEVGSAAEKREARWTCWVAGVEAIDDSDLKVEGWMRSEKMRKQKYAPKPASDIRDAINDGLLYDPRTASMDIQVDVAGSAVTLRGKVDHLRAKRAAEQIARNTVGVSHVTNRIKVRSPRPVDDETIEAQIRRALENDPWVSRYDIAVDANDGDVTLTGQVDSYYEKSQAEELAARSNGVVHIRNRMQVAEGTPFVEDPYLDDAYYDSTWYEYQPDFTIKPDSELKQDVIDELGWSPFVNSEDVKVEVDDRRVTLAGRVTSSLEKRHAEMNAWQAGAAFVENNLRIK